MEGLLDHFHAIRLPNRQMAFLFRSLSWYSTFFLATITTNVSLAVGQGMFLFETSLRLSVLRLSGQGSRFFQRAKKRFAPLTLFDNLTYPPTLFNLTTSKLLVSPAIWQAAYRPR